MIGLLSLLLTCLVQADEVYYVNFNNARQCGFTGCVHPMPLPPAHPAPRPAPRRIIDPVAHAHQCVRLYKEIWNTNAPSSAVNLNTYFASAGHYSTATGGNTRTFKPLSSLEDYLNAFRGKENSANILQMGVLPSGQVAVEVFYYQTAPTYLHLAQIISFDQECNVVSVNELSNSKQFLTPNAMLADPSSCDMQFNDIWDESDTLTDALTMMSFDTSRYGFQYSAFDYRSTTAYTKWEEDDVSDLTAYINAWRSNTGAASMILDAGDFSTNVGARALVWFTQSTTTDPDTDNSVNSEREYFTYGVELLRFSKNCKVWKGARINLNTQQQVALPVVAPYMSGFGEKPDYDTCVSRWSRLFRGYTGTDYQKWFAPGATYTFLGDVEPNTYANSQGSILAGLDDGSLADYINTNFKYAKGIQTKIVDYSILKSGNVLIVYDVILPKFPWPTTYTYTESYGAVDVVSFDSDCRIVAGAQFANRYTTFFTSPIFTEERFRPPQAGDRLYL
eukprot:NODE_1056_length_1684_cov_209.310854_g992_i0.p1 GENE.NODE_1056_length_1684_cov_209.310854_g992_i0~~NODE_1056_length_1684_cov_209.310854_g992_i0.p1  ORF type:complete len:505 (+),score=68.43 NODE_1056_length_1684_cov_209.310854_g992_i0:47-1561(+)